MSWVEDTLDSLNNDSLAWLLVLSSPEGRSFGIGLTSNYHSFRGKVQAFLKNHHIIGIDIRNGYELLTRKTIHSPGGSESILIADKEDLMRFSSVGLSVSCHLKSKPELRDRYLVKLGGESERPVYWFPLEVKANAPIQMVTRSSRGLEEPYKIIVGAHFECSRCGTVIGHEYPMMWQDERCEDVKVVCPKCGMHWIHLKGEPYRRPYPED
jgi:DNA-directed RNA polymerase subunit RPC12/RpoP